MIRAVIFVFCVTLATVYSQVFSQGPCPDNIEVVQNFNPDKFQGKWFENRRFNVNFETNSKCVTFDFTSKDNGEIFDILVKQTFNETNEKRETKTNATHTGKNGEALYNFRVPGLRTTILPYAVVNTDYENFAVTWSCSKFFSQHIEISWVLTRKPKPDAETLKNIDETICRNNIEKDKYYFTDQENCS